MHKVSETAQAAGTAAGTAAGASARYVRGLSRHGVVAAERMANQGIEAAERVTNDPTKRAGFHQLASMLGGSVIIGLGVSLFVHARLGVPAYDVMLTALRDHIGITLGQAAWLFTGFLYVIATFLGRRPKLNSIAYTFINGVAVDVFMALIRNPEPMAVRILFVGLGTVAIAGGIALVIHAGLTGGSLELLMRAGEDRGHDPFKVRRYIEVGIVVVGAALGGDIGIATFFFVIAMGPALRAGRQALTDHRHGRENRLATS